ncbi:MAG: DNA translocase FtsK 4TM domain-containing protein, partial [Flavisolibacter sp.]
MANKLKSNTPATAEKPVTKENAEKAQKASKPKPAAKKKPSPQKLQSDKEERVDLKKLAKDERTWKIIGTVSLLVSIFLFIAFVSYLFTWDDDQSQVINRGVGFLFDNDKESQVSNLLGRLGAYTSHNLIYNGFGLASFLFCTFFFVVGINLLFNRKVFSIWRNLKYVTIGLLIVSISFSFLFSFASFPYGGKVGDMISAWMIGLMGTVGTATLLVVVAACYLIWQFNPSFNLPQRKPTVLPVDNDAEQSGAKLTVDTSLLNGKSVNDLYAEEDPLLVSEKGNLLKGEGEMVLNINNEDNDGGLTLIERDDEEDEDEDVTEELTAEE